MPQPEEFADRRIWATESRYHRRDRYRGRAVHLQGQLAPDARYMVQHAKPQIKYHFCGPLMNLRT